MESSPVQNFVRGFWVLAFTFCNYITSTGKLINSKIAIAGIMYVPHLAINADSIVPQVYFHKLRLSPLFSNIAFLQVGSSFWKNLCFKSSELVTFSGRLETSWDTKASSLKSVRSSARKKEFTTLIKDHLYTKLYKNHLHLLMEA